MSCVQRLQTAMPDLATANRQLASMAADARIDWALAHLPGRAVLSSSFGVQAAVMLHLVTRQQPDIPVLFIDTGYHFPETYRFVDQLGERLSLNLEVCRAELSPAWQEARFGRRWEQGRKGIEDYNQANKVEPLQRKLDELDACIWLSGIRRSQAPSRQAIDYLTVQWQRYKLHPIADWSDRDVHLYLKRHDLPYHPLRDRGYLSIGDWHTTRSLAEVDDLADLRFHGLVRECGLHQS